MLEKAGVATVAGTSFGIHGEGYIRFSYANSVENIREAIKRIATRRGTLSGEMVRVSGGMVSRDMVTRESERGDRTPRQPQSAPAGANPWRDARETSKSCRTI